jgi:hypothetical protein
MAEVPHKLQLVTRHDVGGVKMSAEVSVEQVDSGRLWLAGLVAVVLAVVGNVIVGTLAQALFEIPPQFAPFELPRYVLFTVIGVIGATVVFAVLARMSQRPIPIFQRVAVVVLLLSFIPDLAMLFTDAVPGATVPGVVTLMVMHVVAAVVAIIVLPRMARAG